MNKRLVATLLLVVILAVVQMTVVPSGLPDAKFDSTRGTLEAWVKPNWAYDRAASGHQVIFYWGPQQWSDELRFFVYNQQILAARWMANGKVYSAETALKDWVKDQLHYIATTWDEATASARLYIDGELVSEVSNWVVPQGESSYTIGYTPGGGSMFNGEIMGLTISETVKTAEEIRAAYEAEAAQYQLAANTKDSQTGMEPKASGEGESVAAASVDLVWWDNFPLIIQTNNADWAVRFPSDAIMNGYADDPTWGLFAQTGRMSGSYSNAAAIAERLGLKSIGYYETFGQATTYLAEMKKADDGEWVKNAAGVTDILHHHWNWQNYSGGETARMLPAHLGSTTRTPRRCLR